MNLSLPTRRQRLAIETSSARVPELLSPRTFFVVALCLGAVVFAVYNRALEFQFVLDDHRFTGDPRIQSPGYVWDYFAKYVWSQFTGGPPSFYRLLAVVFAVLVISQEKQWKNDLTVFTVAQQLAPRKAPVAHNLANAHVQAALQLADDGRCSEALPVFEQVSQEYPQDWYAWAGLGDCFAQVNNLPKAEESLRRAAELSHDSRVMQQWQKLCANMVLPSPVPR